MYADRVSSGAKRSISDRLGEGAAAGRSNDAKRQRQVYGTWRRELYKDSGPPKISSGPASKDLRHELSRNLQQDLRSTLNGDSHQDLRSSLNKKSHHVTQVREKVTAPDLREKLLGTKHPKVESTIQRRKPVLDTKSSKAVPKSPTAKPVVPKSAPVKPVEKSAPVKPVDKTTRPVEDASPAPKEVPVATTSGKEPGEKYEWSVDGLLKYLDLEKYAIAFLAEEVDIKALVHMSDEDLKTLGIPMGPRRKILSELDSKARKRSK